MEESIRMRDQEIRAKLQDLIEAESDPKERARLLIMMQISDILIDNVRAVRGLSDEMHTHRTEFADHMRKELELINQGKGMWRVFAVAVGLIQAVIGYAFWAHMSDMDTLKDTKIAVERRLDLIEERMTNWQRVNP